MGGIVADPGFEAPPWCRGPHTQTLWPFLFRSRPRPRYRRERLELPDGDFLDLDWYGPADADSLVIILHGLEGSSSSHYVRALSHALDRVGLASVVMHQRGCGGEPNRLPRFYHGGETADFHFVLERLREARPDRGLYAVGYSLGGNILLKWLGEAGEDAFLEAAVAVSVPFRLDIGARRLERGVSRIYQAYLVGSMKRSVTRKRRFMDHPVNPATLSRCRTFEEIDTCLTAPLHGFRDATDYYSRSSCRQSLHGIRTPTLIIHARDDPFMTPAAVPEEDELSSTTRLELTRAGGHCGFVAGNPLRPRYWLDERIPSFIEAATSGSSAPVSG